MRNNTNRWDLENLLNRSAPQWVVENRVTAAIFHKLCTAVATDKNIPTSTVMALAAEKPNVLAKIAQDLTHSLRPENKEQLNKKMSLRIKEVAELLLIKLQFLRKKELKKELKKFMAELAALKNKQLKEEAYFIALNHLLNEPVPTKKTQEDAPKPQQKLEPVPKLCSKKQINKFLLALGLQAGANREHIKQAFEQIEKNFQAIANPTTEQQEKFDQITAAYEALSALDDEALDRILSSRDEATPEECKDFCQQLNLSPDKDYSLDELDTAVRQYVLENSESSEMSASPEMQDTFQALVNQFIDLPAESLNQFLRQHANANLSMSSVPQLRPSV